ncbi:DUF192 domain-containing protein [Candidatus Nomurabacteria bacterium]|nr:DUF192 domain-containing protein [Candidatus Nomurabacteria bacterium]
MIALHKTRQTRVLYIFSIIAIGALLLVLFLLLRDGPKSVNNSLEDNTYEAILKIGSMSIPVTVADTEEEQQKGLSGTTSLPQDAGKLFIFNTEGDYGFWMKDMAYSLDIVWIDKNFQIIDITENISPNTYPEVFYPSQKAQYVLELNAGFSTEHNLHKNQLITLTNILSF